MVFTPASRPKAAFLGTLLLVGLVGCGRPASDADSTRLAPPDRSAPDRRPAATGSTPGESKTADVRPRIVALGDSLTAGLGLDKDQAYPADLQRKIDAEGLNFEVVNAGVSGDTSAGGWSRLDWALDGNVKVLILALGANDGLRGLPVSEMERNLQGIIDAARTRRIKVLLAGMETPGNMGAEYRKAFHDVFPRLAKKNRDVAFLPFLLEAVAGKPELNQSDRIHPTAEGARIVADHLWPVLQPLLTTTKP